jgi:hypothetical protein
MCRSEVTGISRALVTERVQALTDHGYLRAVSARAPTGRPPELLQIRRDAGDVVVALLGRSTMRSRHVAPMSRRRSWWRTSPPSSSGCSGPAESRLWKPVAPDPPVRSRSGASSRCGLRSLTPRGAANRSASILCGTGPQPRGPDSSSGKRRSALPRGCRLSLSPVRHGRACVGQLRSRHGRRAAAPAGSC